MDSGLCLCLGLVLVLGLGLGSVLGLGLGLGLVLVLGLDLVLGFLQHFRRLISLILSRFVMLGQATRLYWAAIVAKNSENKI